MQTGFPAVSVEEISRGAGTNCTSFYRHFASKEALMEELASSQATEMRARCDFLISQRIEESVPPIEMLLQGLLFDERIGSVFDWLLHLDRSPRFESRSAGPLVKYHPLQAMRALLIDLLSESDGLDKSIIADGLILLLCGVAHNRAAGTDEPDHGARALAIARCLIQAGRRRAA